MVIKFSCVTAYFQAIAIFDLSFSPKLTMLYFTAIKPTFRTPKYYRGKLRR
ncbi:hypothetical protein [Aphanizomenon sp. CS-733/32]|uniref:hypothetical protein n=1 Tax=Aphanizomenon sp. CS-733/32 TaxID=3021715 RepID=UPI003FA46284